MKKILITGAGGFIGSHLTEYCAEQGFQVKAFVRYNSNNKVGWLEKSNVLNDIEVVIGDIRDFDSVYRAMKGVDTVFHLAALIGIPYSYLSPLAYIKTNVEGTYNILEIARLLEIDNLLVTSTSETYGSSQYAPIDEFHPSVGQSPYAATKISADQLAISYYRSFGLPVKIVRPFNTYGPRQSERAIIPTVISQILSGEKSIKLGSLTPTRDLTFVKDTVSGILEIAKCKQLIGEATNIGMNMEISIEQLVKLIASLLKVNIEIVEDSKRVRPKNSEVHRLLCNNSKLKNCTQWNASYNLNKGLQETIEWFENRPNLHGHQNFII
jgi:NAD dependent epimerase/dehydratase